MLGGSVLLSLVYVLGDPVWDFGDFLDDGSKLGVGSGGSEEMRRESTDEED